MTRYLVFAATAALLLAPEGAAQRGRAPSAERMLQRFDADKDGKLTKDELGERMWRRMGSADVDQDGVITKKELESIGTRRRGRGRGGNSGEAAWKFLAEKYDANKDGKIEKSEYDRDEKTFARLDKNGDGALTQKDWQTESERRRGRNRGSRPTAPKAGQQAPDFELTFVEDKAAKVKLSSYAGNKPVALIFGSCT